MKHSECEFIKIRETTHFRFKWRLWKMESTQPECFARSIVTLRDGWMDGWRYLYLLYITYVCVCNL